MTKAQRQINYPMALWRRKWLILPLVALGLAGSMLLFSRVTPLYRAQATVVLIPQSISKEIYPIGWQIGDRLKFIEREINSTTFLDALAAAQGVEEKDPEKLRRLTRTVAVKKLDWETFVFSSVHPNPRIAAEKTNLVARIFVEQSQKRKIIQSESSMEFLVDEVDRLTEEIEEERKVLAEYKAAHRGELPSDREGHRREQAFLRKSISELDARIETKTKDLESRQFLLENPDQEGTARPDALPEAPRDPRLAQLAKLRGELDEALLRYTKRHPQVVRLQASVDALVSEINSKPFVPSQSPAGQAAQLTQESGEASSLSDFIRLEILRLSEEISEMTAQKAQLRAEIDRLENLVQLSYQRDNELGRITARIGMLEKKLFDNQGKLEILQTEQEVFERGMDMRYELKDAAGVPLLPFHPDLLTFIIMGVVGGGGLGVGIALLLEVMDRNIWTTEDLEEVLDVEILAVIPNMDKVHKSTGSGRRGGGMGRRRREAAHG